MAVSQEDTPEVEEPFWEIEKILRWRKVKRENKIIKEFLVLWKNFSVDEASCLTVSQFFKPELLNKFIQEDKPEEESCK